MMNSIAEAPRNAINTNGLQDSLATPLACWEPLSEFELIAIPTIRLTNNSRTTTTAYVARLSILTFPNNR
jgi:hypothetical protein